MAKRKHGLTIRALDGEALVYDPETTRASCLNQFASAVLERCDGTRSPAEIARDLPFENVDPRLVALALADLQKAELLEADAVTDPPVRTGRSRREFFRSIGLGTAVAVPVVTAIVLPTAAQAVSVGAPCNDQGDCGSLLRCRQRGSGKDCPNQPKGNDCTCQP